jgi:hypothetical protein
MPRPAQLKQALQQVTSKPAAPARERAPKRSPAAAPVAPSREGKIAVTGFYDPDVRMQLKILAAEQKTTIQDLVTEALNGLFERYGKPPIAS